MLVAARSTLATLATRLSLGKSLTALSVVIAKDDEDLAKLSWMMVPHNCKDLAQSLIGKRCRKFGDGINEGERVDTGIGGTGRS